MIVYTMSKILYFNVLSVPFWDISMSQTYQFPDFDISRLNTDLWGSFHGFINHSFACLIEISHLICSTWNTCSVDSSQPYAFAGSARILIKCRRDFLSVHWFSLATFLNRCSNNLTSASPLNMRDLRDAEDTPCVVLSSTFLNWFITGSAAAAKRPASTDLLPIVTSCTDGNSDSIASTDVVFSTTEVWLPQCVRECKYWAKK